MERDILDIIVDKEFFDLTTVEKEELAQFCKTKAEFDELKIAVLGMNAVHFEMQQPKAKIKQKLDDLFAQTYPKAATVWYNSVFVAIVPREKPFYRQPLLQIAAVLIALFLVVPLMNNPINRNTEKIAKLDQKDADKSVVNKTEQNTPTIELELEKPLEEDDLVSNALGNSMLSEEEVVLKDIDLGQGSSLFSRSELPASSADTLSFSSFTADFIVAEDTEESSPSHPDGVFSGIANERVDYSADANDTDDLLGLCTVTF